MTQNNRELPSYMKTVDNGINNVVESLRMNSVTNEKLTEELQNSVENLLDNFITATSTALAREISSSNFRFQICWSNNIQTIILQ